MATRARLLSAMVVLALLPALVAVIVAACAAPAGVRHPSTVTSALGYRWHVVRVHDASGRLALPASTTAGVFFTRDGYVLGDDTVNALQGNWHATTAGYTVSPAGSTLVAYAGGDPTVLRTVAAVDAMFFRLNSTRPVAVTVAVHGDALTLSSGDNELDLTRSGAEPDFSSAVSPTSSR